MRAVILVLVIAIIAIIAAIASGYLDINQTRAAKTPSLSRTENGIQAQGGQAPAFDVETGSVKVGATETNVRVPQLQIQKPQNEAAPVTNNAQ